MQLAIATSKQPDPEAASRECRLAISTQLDGAPDLILAFCSSLYDVRAIAQELSRAGARTQVHGTTSALGVFDAQGLCSENGFGLGLLGIRDPRGAYGVAAAPFDSCPRSAAHTALKQALHRAGRPGELPALIWLNSAPGAEEAVLAGFRDLLGSSVPVVGGSSADNSIEGEWRQFTAEEVHHEGVVVTALYPSVGTSLAFSSGYEPTAHGGFVTRCQGRTILEIDGDPAAEVYNRWTDGLVEHRLREGGPVLFQTTLHPLGRVVERVEGVPLYLLSHPGEINAGGGLSLFTEISEGDRVVLMRGTRKSLVRRAARVVQAALDARANPGSPVAGTLLTFCAGCMLTLGEEMNRVADQVRGVHGERPLLGYFSLGEQGSFVEPRQLHGNLMISAVIFSSRPTIGGGPP